jgi:hypothetical protein
MRWLQCFAMSCHVLPLLMQKAKKMFQVSRHAFTTINSDCLDYPVISCRQRLLHSEAKSAMRKGYSRHLREGGVCAVAAASSCELLAEICPMGVEGAGFLKTIQKSPYRHRHRHTHRERERDTERQRDRQTARQPDRQTDAKSWTIVQIPSSSKHSVSTWTYLGNGNRMREY